MTRTEILDELKLSKDFIIHECYETDKIIFVTVSKDASPSQITEGSDVSWYAKWKNEGDWFKPDFYKHTDVYKEIHDVLDKSNELK